MDILCSPGLAVLHTAFYQQTVLAVVEIWTTTHRDITIHDSALEDKFTEQHAAVDMQPKASDMQVTG